MNPRFDPQHDDNMMSDAEKAKPADYAELLAKLEGETYFDIFGFHLSIPYEAAAAIRFLIGERDRALTNEYITKSNRDEMIPQFKHLLARAEAAEAIIAWIETFDPRIVDDARDALARKGEG